MIKIEVQVINKSNNPLPQQGSIHAAGFDVRANLNPDTIKNRPGVNSIIIAPNETYLVPTGLFTAIPIGYEIQVRPRSGLALKHGITIANTPGTIDADYRGECCVMLRNESNEPFEVKNGDRIAQFVLNQVPTIEWVKVNELPDTDRGIGGFGSTGKD